MSITGLDLSQIITARLQGKEKKLPSHSVINPGIKLQLLKHLNLKWINLY